ncbi:MAG TPA: Asp-tRNA(Asn)/Glu-tRNA(Gln) amidotransferase subunit GatC [Terriglobales bacterium]
MKISDQDVAYVADLANLELTEDERKRILRDLNSILEHVDRLNQLDTSGVEPMTQVLESVGAENNGGSRLASAAREDVLEGLRKSLTHEVALVNAPKDDGAFFLVPKVIEK